MNFKMATYHPFMEVRQGYEIQTQPAFSVIQKQKILTETLQKMQRKGLIEADIQRIIAFHQQQEKMEKVDEKGWKKNFLEKSRQLLLD